MKKKYDFFLLLFLLLREINTFIQQGWIKLKNGKSKNICNVMKDLYFK